VPEEQESASSRAVHTVDEVAAILRISRSAAYAAVKAGEIQAVRIGRAWRVPHRVLDDLLGREPECGEETG
jgi:excisionase family DNA binding protein